ncbi:MAG: biopolymer transporter ExbD [Thermoanaerobaculum sp.]|nr:biopolymer transporter ExbD [Thermoanaerobaculum sp.]MDW7967417.1 biopolymer transporter ExbD [Thermoanaerobaculum sp.]
MRFSRPRSRTPRIDISPLIDVVFQLLLFYAVTTQFVTPERLKLQLPEAKTAETARTPSAQETEILVTSSGAIYLGGQEVSEDRLEGELRGLLKGQTDRSVTIRGDKGAPYGIVMRVLDAARLAGAQHINLVASKPQHERR